MQTYTNYYFFIQKVTIIKIVFISFIQSESYTFTNTEQKNKLRILIEILILPSYAKFIFFIDNDIKSIFLDLIYYYITLNSTPIDIKLYQFLKENYVNDKYTHKITQSKITLYQYLD